MYNADKKYRIHTVFLKIRIWVKLFKGYAQFLGKYGRKFTDKPF